MEERFGPTVDIFTDSQRRSCGTAQDLVDFDLGEAGIKSATRTGLLKKGSGQVFYFLPASHEQQPGKKIELYSCNK